MSNSANIFGFMSQVYRKLYEQGVCIVEDFFNDPNDGQHHDVHYPPPLFECSEEQATFVTKQGISRQRCFDGVKRSCTTCAYDTLLVEDHKVSHPKKIAGPGPRLQLKPCKVLQQTDQPSISMYLALTVICSLGLTNYVHFK
jgi:hypothetical protein